MGKIINIEDRINKNKNANKNVNLRDRIPCQVINLDVQSITIAGFINDILDYVEDMMQFVNDLYVVLGLQLDESTLNDLQDRRSKLKDLYDYLKKPIDMDFDELIFKLKIILEQSNYFSSLYELAYEKDTMDYPELKFYISLVDLYVTYVSSVLASSKFNYDDFDGTLNKEKTKVFDEVSKLKYEIHREEISLALMQMGIELLGDNHSIIQEYSAFLCVNEVIDDFYEYDIDTITNCFLDLMVVYKKNGVFEEENNEGVEMIIKKISDEVNCCKDYYKTSDVVSHFMILLGSYIHDNSLNEKIVNNLKGLLSNLIKISNDKKQKDKLVHIKCVIDGVCTKIYSRIKGNANDLSKEEMESGLYNIINDRLMLNAISLISKDLLDYSTSDSKEKNYLDSNNFDYIWSYIGMISVKKELNSIVTRDIFDGKDDDIYRDKYYRELLTRTISQLSDDMYDFDQLCAKDVDDDFTIVLDMLKKGLKLEKTINLYGMSEKVWDIRNLNYTDTARTKTFLDLVDGLFSKMKYDFCLSDFLNDAKYNPMNIITEKQNYISLYSDQNNSLVMDKNDYYVIENKDIIEVLGMALVDYNYANKNITYSMILENISKRYKEIKNTIYGNGRTKKL